MATGSYLSVITLNVNGLNAPTKRQRLAEWIQKQDPYICCLQETHLKTGDTYRLKVKGWKKIFHANRDQKKAGVAILISDKIDFKTKAVKNTCYKFNLPSTITGLIFNLLPPSPILPKKGGIREKGEKNFLKGNMVKDLYGEQKGCLLYF